MVVAGELVALAVPRPFEKVATAPRATVHGRRTDLPLGPVLRCKKRAGPLAGALKALEKDKIHADGA